jgi:DHA1 family tetracycline resistance protein-like MFS transporter
MRKPSVLIIFLTVFIDLIGFGIVVPLVPLFSKHFGAEGFVIGVVIASFSAMQFLFAPVWGRLSDRIGRRPVLLGSTLGAAGSYVLFALSSGIGNRAAGLWLLIASRVFAGICGANITVAQAYIADITPPEQRSKRMGLIGMAFGLGFIFGPALGGISLAGFTVGGYQVLGLRLPLLHFAGFGLSGPGWVAAAICAVNFLLALFILNESRQPTSEHVPPRPHLDQWMHTLTQPRIGLLVVVFFLATFCFSCFESTLPLLVTDNFHLDMSSDKASAKTVTQLFVFCGLIGAVVQGGAIGRLVKKMGEPKLIVLSLVLTAISLALLPFIKGTTQLTWRMLFHPEGVPWLLMLFALGLLAIGSSLTRPPLFGLLSTLTAAHEQGATIGVAQGAGSLARILGPIFATTLLHYLPPLPYLTCTGVLLGTAIMFARKMGSEPAPAATAATTMAMK